MKKPITLVKELHLPSLREKYMSDPDIIPPSGTTKQEYVDQMVGQLERQNRNNSRAYSLLTPTASDTAEGGGSDMYVQINRIKKAAKMLQKSYDEEDYMQAIKLSMQQHSDDYSFLKAKEDPPKYTIHKRYSIASKVKERPFLVVDHPTLDAPITLSRDKGVSGKNRSWYPVYGHGTVWAAGTAGYGNIAMSHVKKLEKHILSDPTLKAKWESKGIPSTDKFARNNFSEINDPSVFPPSGKGFSHGSAKKPDEGLYGLSKRARNAGEGREFDEYNKWIDHVKSLAEILPIVAPSSGQYKEVPELNTDLSKFVHSVHHGAMGGKGSEAIRTVNLVQARIMNQIDPNESPKKQIINAQRDSYSPLKQDSPEQLVNIDLPDDSHVRASVLPLMEVIHAINNDSDIDDSPVWQIGAGGTEMDPSTGAPIKLHTESMTSSDAVDRVNQIHLEHIVGQPNDPNRIPKERSDLAFINSKEVQALLKFPTNSANRFPGVDAALRYTGTYREGMADSLHGIINSAVFKGEKPTSSTPTSTTTEEDAIEAPEVPEDIAAYFGGTSKLGESPLNGDEFNSLSPLRQHIMIDRILEQNAKVQKVIDLGGAAPTANNFYSFVDNLKADLHDEKSGDYLDSAALFADDSPYSEDVSRVMPKTTAAAEEVQPDTEKPVTTAAAAEKIEPEDTAPAEDDDTKEDAPEISAPAEQVEEANDTEGPTAAEEQAKAMEQVALDEINARTKNAANALSPEAQQGLANAVIEMKRNEVNEVKKLGEGATTKQLEGIAESTKKQEVLLDESLDKFRIYGQLPDSKEGKEHTKILNETIRQLTGDKNYEAALGRTTDESGIGGTDGERAREPVVQPVEGDAEQSGASEGAGAKVSDQNVDRDSTGRSVPNQVDDSAISPSEEIPPSDNGEQGKLFGDDVGGPVSDQVASDAPKATDPVSKDGRIMTTVELADGTVQPFYRRTGTGGKDRAAEAGQWVPFDGIHKGGFGTGADGKDVYQERGWFDKHAYTKGEDGESLEDKDPLKGYGTQEHKDIGERLDAAFDAGNLFENQDAIIEHETKKRKDGSEYQSSSVKNKDYSGSSDEPLKGAKELNQHLADQGSPHAQQKIDRWEGRDHRFGLPPDEVDDEDDQDDAQEEQEEIPADGDVPPPPPPPAADEEPEEDSDEINHRTERIAKLGDDALAALVDEDEFGYHTPDAVRRTLLNPKVNTAKQFSAHMERARGTHENNQETERRTSSKSHRALRDSIRNKKGLHEVIQEHIADHVATHDGREVHDLKYKDLGTYVRHLNSLSDDDRRKELEDHQKTAATRAEDEEKEEAKAAETAETEASKEKQEQDKAAWAAESQRVQQQMGAMPSLLGPDGKKIADKWDNTQSIHYFRNLHKIVFHETRVNLKKAGVDTSHVKDLSGLLRALGEGDSIPYDVKTMISNSAMAVNSILTPRQRRDLSEEMQNEKDYMGDDHRKKLAVENEKARKNEEDYQKRGSEVVEKGSRHPIFSGTSDDNYRDKDGKITPLYSDPEDMQKKDEDDARIREEGDLGEESQSEKAKRRVSQGHPPTESPGEGYAYHPESGQWMDKERLDSLTSHFDEHLKNGESVSFAPANTVHTEHIGKDSEGNRGVVLKAHEPLAVRSKGASDYVSVTKNREGQLIWSPVKPPEQNKHGFISPDVTQHVTGNPELDERLNNAHAVGQIKGTFHSQEHEEGSTGDHARHGMEHNVIRHHNLGGKAAPKNALQIGNKINEILSPENFSNIAGNILNFSRKHGGSLAKKLKLNELSEKVGQSAGGQKVGEAAQKVGEAAQKVGEASKDVTGLYSKQDVASLLYNPLAMPKLYNRLFVRPIVAGAKKVIETAPVGTDEYGVPKGGRTRETDPVTGEETPRSRVPGVEGVKSAVSGTKGRLAAVVPSEVSEAVGAAKDAAKDVVRGGLYAGNEKINQATSAAADKADEIIDRTKKGASQVGQDIASAGMAGVGGDQTPSAGPTPETRAGQEAKARAQFGPDQKPKDNESERDAAQRLTPPVGTLDKDGNKMDRTARRKAGTTAAKAERRQPAPEAPAPVGEDKPGVAERAAMGAAGAVDTATEKLRGIGSALQSRKDSMPSDTDKVEVEQDPSRFGSDASTGGKKMDRAAKRRQAKDIQSKTGTSSKDVQLVHPEPDTPVGKLQGFVGSVHSGREHRVDTDTSVAARPITPTPENTPVTPDATPDTSAQEGLSRAERRKEKFGSKTGVPAQTGGTPSSGATSTAAPPQKRPDKSFMS
jgi:hypothetical protein